MTTTIMKDSVVGDAWIQQTAANVPVQKCINPETGQPTGDLLTGPVRLTFPNIFSLPPKKEGESDPKYGSGLLFTPYADFTLFYEAYYALCAQHFQQNYVAETQQYVGIYSPFRQQAEKLNFGGFTPGLTWLSATSKFKPQVVDVRGNPIVDPAKVYPGVWAIASVNAYKFTDARKKGVAFGLQSLMIIGDDTKLGNGAPDARKTFAGVGGAIAAPPVQAGVQLPPGQNGQMPPPAGGMPPPPPGGTYAPPPAAAGGYAPPPAAGGYTMPGAPVGAPPDPRGPVPVGYSSWGEYDSLMNGL